MWIAAVSLFPKMSIMRRVEIIVECSQRMLMSTFYLVIDIFTVRLPTLMGMIVKQGFITLALRLGMISRT